MGGTCVRALAFEAEDTLLIAAFVMVGLGT
jgi:hypothetical protein